MKPISHRTIIWAYRYIHGDTLQKIGDDYGVTRERVRQCLKKIGLVREDGGVSVRALANARYKAPKDKYLNGFGCFRSEAEKANDGLPFTQKGTKAYAYKNQRCSAAKRGIDWEFTFPQWVELWKASGKWELRGRGKGYCMTRIGDTGPYSPDNVEIKTIGENFSESYFKHPWRVRFAGIHIPKDIDRNQMISKGSQ